MTTFFICLSGLVFCNAVLSFVLQHSSKLEIFALNFLCHMQLKIYVIMNSVVTNLLTIVLLTSNWQIRYLQMYIGAIIFFLGFYSACYPWAPVCCVVSEVYYIVYSGPYNIQLAYYSVLQSPFIAVEVMLFFYCIL